MTTITDHEVLRRMHQKITGWDTLKFPDRSEELLENIANGTAYEIFVDDMDGLNRDVSCPVMEKAWVLTVKETLDIFKHGFPSLERQLKLFIAVSLIHGNEVFNVNEYWAAAASDCPGLDITKTFIDYFEILQPLSALFNKEIDPEEAEKLEIIYQEVRSKRNREAFAEYWRLKESGVEAENKEEIYDVVDSSDDEGYYADGEGGNSDEESLNSP